MSKNPHQIRREIAALERKLKEAEKEQKQKAERAVVRAARRSGLLNAELSPAELEAAFRRIVSPAEAGSAVRGETLGNDAERRIGSSKMTEVTSHAG